MNTPKTPKQPKRFTQSIKWPTNTKEAIEHGLRSEKHLEWIGRIVVQFCHTEQEIVWFAALLSGANNEAAAIILDTVKNPKARQDILRRLLTEHHLNARFPEDADDILETYRSISAKRNNIVHGLWFTGDKTKTVYLAATDGTINPVVNGKPVTVAELSAFHSEIVEFEDRLISCISKITALMKG